MSKIKTKIVEHLASEAYAKMQEALGEVTNLQNAPQFMNRSEGIGLDLAVLREQIEAGIKFINLLR